MSENLPRVGVRRHFCQEVILTYDFCTARSLPRSTQDRP